MTASSEESLKNEIKKLVAQNNDLLIKSKTLSAVLDHVPNPVFYKDTKRIYLGCNAAFEEFTGLSKKKIIGSSVYDIAQKELAVEYEKADNELLESKSLQIYESKVTASKGAVHEVVFRKSVFYDDNTGEIAGIVGIIIDVTDINNKTKLVKKSELRFRELAELLPQIVFEIDLKGNVLFANRKAEDITGYSYDDLKHGLTIFDFFSEEERKRLKRNIRKVLNGETLNSTEYTIKRKDGTNLVVIANTSVVEKDNKPVGLRGILVDVTKSKENERLANKFFDSLEVLYKTTIGFLQINSQEEILERAGKELHRLYPNSILFVNSIYQNKASVEFIYGLPKVITKGLLKIANLSGKKRIKIPPKIMNMLQPGKLIELAEEVTHVFPESVLNGVKKVISIDEIYAVGLAWDNSLYGSLVLLVENDEEFNPEIIETFARITSIALQKVTMLKKLQRSEQKYRTLFDAGLMGIGILSGKYFKYVNYALVQALEYENELDIMSDSVYDHILDEDKLLIDRAVDDLVKRKDSTVEIRVRTKPGKIKHFEVLFTKILLDDEENILAYFNDITIRKIAERAVKESNEKFSGIVNALTDVIYMIDESGTLLWANPVAVRTLGANIYGQNHTRIFYTEKEANQCPCYEVFNNSKIVEYEARAYVEGYEKIFWCTANVATKKETGKPEYIIIIARDITERTAVDRMLKLKEKQLNKAQGLASIGSFEYYFNNRKRYFSDNFFDVLGVSPEVFNHDEIHTPLFDFIHPDDQAKLMSYMQQGVSLNYFDEVIRFVIAGNDRYLRIIYELEKEKKTPVKFHVTIQDVTRQKNYEQEIQNAKRNAEESDRLKSAFLANMSHEIRTPMNAILGFAELLKRKSFNEDKRAGFVDIISSKGRELLTLIDDIIDISKIEANQLRIVSVPCILNNVMSEINETFKTNIDLLDKNIKLIQECDASLGSQVVLLDEIRLKQIFNNLISNAIKFTDKGSISYGVNLKENSLFFYVKDTGIGITKEQQQIIFGRFRQADDSISRKYGGTGLGLSISAGLVNLMGGKIGVKSEMEKGTVFYFTLPYRLTDNDIVDVIEDVPVSIEKKWHGKKVLIVEDTQSNYDYLETLLQLSCLELVHAKSGEEAVELCRKKKFDLVLMDIQLPKISGNEAVQILRKEGYDVPIIAQTAHIFDKDKEKSLQAGCNDFIPKPINADTLIAKIDKYIGK